jgi:hypothetical protein
MCVGTIESMINKTMLCDERPLLSVHIPKNKTPGNSMPIDSAIEDEWEVRATIVSC